MYFYKINLKEDSGIGDYSSGNSFFELLATFSGVENLQADKYDILDKINSTIHSFINSNDFHSDAHHYLSWTDDPNDLDFEKWAKLLVKDLYKYDIVSLLDITGLHGRMLELCPFISEDKISNWHLRVLLLIIKETCFIPMSIK